MSASSRLGDRLNSAEFRLTRALGHLRVRSVPKPGVGQSCTAPLVARGVHTPDRG
jgi:hypothetical protein